MAESEELKSLLMKVKEESEKAGLILNSQKTKIMASGRETVETVTDFFFLGSKFTAIVTAAMKLKDAYSLDKRYDQPRQHTKKQRHYFANKGPSSQSFGFPVVMYGCESWIIKKGECWRIDAFELCVGEDSLESLGLQDPTSPS